MSFFIYDLIFLVVFSSFLVIFLVKRKKKLQREGILILYRTQLGIKIINYIGNKYKRILEKLEPVIIFTGYALMAGMLFLLFQLVYIFAKFPQFVKAIKIPPLLPLVPYIPRIFKLDFLPPFYFTYWIIVLAIAAITHEFAHGIWAKIKDIEIKSTGFAFLGPFLAAFVEPDEKKVEKLEPKHQLAFLSAGTFANVIMTILFFIIMYLFFIAFFNPAGVIFNSYTSSVINMDVTEITEEKLNIDFNGGLNLTKVLSGGKSYYINEDDLDEKDLVGVFEDAPALKAGLIGVIVEFEGKEITTYQDLGRELSSKKPGDEVSVKTKVDEEIKEYNIKLIESPGDKERAYMGIALVNTRGISVLSKLRGSVLFFKDPNTYYKPKFNGDLLVFIYNLIWWIVLINFSIALVNMLPLGIFDGGRVFYLTVLMITKSKSVAKKAYKFSTWFLLFVFLLLMVLWFVSFIG
tara:strand:- start:82 stop:1467 length:1386 start_codon:yes stop_codon:yes gene_type:complete